LMLIQNSATITAFEFLYRKSNENASKTIEAIFLYIKKRSSPLSYISTLLK
jgi:hypothetical protein